MPRWPMELHKHVFKEKPWPCSKPGLLHLRPAKASRGGRTWDASSKLAEPELVPMMPVGSMSAAGIGDPQGHSIGCRNQLPMAERSPAVS